MKKCKQCDVYIDSSTRQCPLCAAPLPVKEGETAHFPADVKVREYNLYLRLLFFISVCIATLCLFFDKFLTGAFDWSLIVVINLLYVWINSLLLLKRRRKIGMNILAQVVTISLVLLAIDYFTGDQGWSHNYAMPFLYTSASVGIGVVAVIKKAQFQEVVLYYLVVCLIGLLPVFLLLFGIVDVMWPSILSVLTSFLVLVAAFIFMDKDTKADLQHRFHL